MFSIAIITPSIPLIVAHSLVNLNLELWRPGIALSTFRSSTTTRDAEVGVRLPKATEMG